MMFYKISQNQYVNTFIKDSFIKYSKHFQDLTTDVLDPIVEFVRWCPYFESETLKFLHKELCSGTE